MAPSTPRGRSQRRQQIATTSTQAAALRVELAGEPNNATLIIDHAPRAARVRCSGPKARSSCAVIRDHTAGKGLDRLPAPRERGQRLRSTTRNRRADHRMSVPERRICHALWTVHAPDQCARSSGSAELLE